MYFETMKQPAISAVNLGKRYQTYAKPINRLKQSIFRHKQYYEEFWALRNVSLEVEKGSSLAIIGKNGSGKSTLLQLLCGTLTPTEGDVRVCGKIGALLELGSGFNPEFTGLENIYLNASILGLSKRETDAVLEDIKAFADIGDFIYQPIKTYSSGMIVRLAFSVMAHIDPEILVIDEALAVGDAFFTQKCSRFLKSFRERGTLLFVSHDMESVKALCDRAIWIDRGQLKQEGPTRLVANSYFAEAYGNREDISSELDEAENVSKSDGGLLKEDSHKNGSDSYQPIARLHPWFDERQRQWGDQNFGSLMQISSFSEAIQNSERFGSSDTIEILHVELLDPVLGASLTTCRGGYPYSLHVVCHCNADIPEPDIGFCLNDRSGQVFFCEPRIQWRQGQTYRAIFEFDFPLLRTGEYTITVAAQKHSLERPDIITWIHDALLVIVHQSSIGAGLSGIPMRRIAISQDSPDKNDDAVSKNKDAYSEVTALKELQRKDLRYRIAMTTSCRDCDPIKKVDNAGETIFDEVTEDEFQIMHNGLMVIKGGYYGDWMSEIILSLRGHHEPQEEFVFDQLLKRIEPTASMIELGSFWSYYSLWFLKDYSNSRKAVCLEADPVHLAIGQRNAEINGLSPVFINGFARDLKTDKPIQFETEKSGTIKLNGWSVEALMTSSDIEYLDILHVDTQGAEYSVLLGAERAIKSKKIRFVVLSTHSYEICGDALMHQRCLKWLTDNGAHIICEHDVHESYSGDGLIVASFSEKDQDWHVSVSHNRYSNSLFPNPAYYVPMRPRTLSL